MSEMGTTQLERLAAELDQRRFHVRLEQQEGRPPVLRVINPVAPALSERVTMAPKSDGSLWFWFPAWPAPITLATDVGNAADRIERVLAEVGRALP